MVSFFCFIISVKNIAKLVKIISGGALINAMKGALGDVLDPAALAAMEVSKAMAAAGASKEEIEEMMAVILNRGGTVSQEFLEAIKEVMESGGKHLIHIFLAFYTNNRLVLQIVYFFCGYFIIIADT